MKCTTYFAAASAITIVIAGCTTMPALVEDTDMAMSPNDPLQHSAQIQDVTECLNESGTEFDIDCLRRRGMIALLVDSDRDGLATYEELEQGLNPNDPLDGPDIDGDGIPNGEDDDVDGDGTLNRYDFDVDGDGLLNGFDPDIDADGLIGRDDPDEDGDDMSDRWDLDEDGDGDEDDDDDDDDDEETTLENLVGRLRRGELTDKDRQALAREIAEHLKAPAAQQAVLGAITEAVTRSQDLLRMSDALGIPAGIAAVDAVYDQLSKALTATRTSLGVKPGDPLPENALAAVVGEFLPRATAIADLANSFQLLSIRELSLAVSDLTAGLGSARRAGEFADALKDSSALDPLALTEDDELDKLVTSAALLGRVFDEAEPREILNVIRGLDELVDTKEELFELVREVRDLGRMGRDLDDAYADVHDPLVDDDDSDDDDEVDDSDDF
ncbi:MAG: hypothetical protein AB7N71_12315 [Phycisphaerae bacterium]